VSVCFRLIVMLEQCGAVPGRCLARRGSAIREAKPFARFVLDCHLLRRGKCLISPISSPVLALELPVLRNNRKLLGRPSNRFESWLIFSRPAAQDPSKACFGSEFSKNSLFLGWRPVSLDCIRHHPVSGSNLVRPSRTRRAAGETGVAAGEVLGSAKGLVRLSEALRDNVDRFIGNIRAA
jgi:hypothetical protein